MKPLCFAIAVLANCFSLFLLGEGGSVGINYGRVANNLPSPKDVVQLIKQQGFTKVKLYDTDPTVLAAFAGSGLELVVALPNERVHAAAQSKNAARQWVQMNVARHLPATKIVGIAVGNEILASTTDSVRALTPLLLPAMENVHSALTELHLDSSIKISSPHSLAILSSSYPPSAGAFNPSIANTIMKPMLDFLAKTNSYVMLNAYPFFAYESEPDVISLEYAIFASKAGVKDPKTGLYYTNLFDAQLDAFFAAMALLGHSNLNIVVAETGWPSKGDTSEIGASPRNAAMYMSNLMKHITSNSGTPLRRGASIDTYIFALFNENMKDGPTSERNYGLFYPDKHNVYDLDMTLPKSHTAVSATRAPMTPGSGQSTQSPSTKSAHRRHRSHHKRQSSTNGAKSNGPSWCVAIPSTNLSQLQAALDYACGPGKVDCSSIQEGKSCFNPNTLVGHASYAFNYYYHANNQAPGSCNFGGSATIVQQDPSYNGCSYPGTV
ncbi:hypothetical protein GOP47_0013179 [Adiantum capillus-veneris]|uniref:glucan endo-1,3-beta-D-glucosidase n=1 Tax=Adiantum capillus-veneris TaxID=13818 RepID=A0A9D4ZCX5_ADICA|nr:hypothetical protein GOP47_0013179 [Adiantum capillus-veneris]